MGSGCCRQQIGPAPNVNVDVVKFAGFIPIIVGNRFQCPWEKWRTPGVGDVMDWVWRIKDNTNLPAQPQLKVDLPVLAVKTAKLNLPPGGGIQVMWIGHATVLVQFDGITILTDPMFSDTCGPFFDKERRYRPASCQIADIPKLDAVIISHDHDDHFDEFSVKELIKHFPGLQWYVGLGFTDLLTGLGCKLEDIHEMTWWQTESLQLRAPPNKIDFTCTPSQHWCRRGLTDQNKRLWCSWVVKGPNKSFFFPGDTGYYRPLFQKIGKEYGPFDLAALPIGAYEPRYFLKYQHLEPKEAVNIHQDIGAKKSIGIHWGTFALAKEWYLEPPQKLEEEMVNANLVPTDFPCLELGEIWTVGAARIQSVYMNVPFLKIQNKRQKKTMICGH